MYSIDVNYKTENYLAQVNINFTDREGYSAQVLIPEFDFEDVPVRFVAGAYTWDMQWCPLKQALFGEESWALGKYDDDLYVAAAQVAHFARHCGPNWYR